MYRWWMRNLSIALLWILCLGPAWAEDPIIPDSSKTPGVFIADATVDKICQKGYTATVRHVTSSQRNRIFQKYGIEKSSEYEVDHLISLELGGSNDDSNLWPQSYRGIWNARLKDILENRLHYLVCADKISLREAQHMISTNWIQAYCKVISTATCKGLE